MLQRDLRCLASLDTLEEEQLRVFLGLPDVTPEELRVVMAERKLKEALKEGIVGGWHGSRVGGGYRYWLYNRNEAIIWTSGAITCHRSTGAEAAAAEVDRLRAEQAKRPEPDLMDYPQMHTELYNMGWRQLHAIEGYAHRKHGCIWNDEWTNGDG